MNRIFISKLSYIAHAEYILTFVQTTPTEVAPLMYSFMVAKLHGLRVTGADLHYEGSIALDPDLCDRVGMMPLQFVEIWNKTTGSRLSTYIIHGEAGSRCCVLNGAAARTCQVGDELIVAARADVSAAEVASVSARVLTLTADNAPDQLTTYALGRERNRWRLVNRLGNKDEAAIVADQGS
ncbi:MAG TPA: aspartate 1-decarboxylase [Steroidobacteraceae bacterium]|nr:aspartate 1-decarboxylase [Steroidobacteraceae bacterium]